MRRRLAPVITASGFLQGVAFAVVAGMVLIAPVLVALALVGMASAVMMVAGRTLLQRSTDDGVLARVFAVQEGTALVGWAVGAAVARFLVERWGSADAFLALGAGVALFTVAGFALMRRLDARAVLRPQETALLRGVPFLSVLPAYELERLAQDAVWEDVPVGTVIVREGDVGDRFYVVGSGQFAVTRDDGTRLHAMGPGHGFGEIALMRSVPRTATVTAATDGRLLVISADDFLAVLTGSVDGTALAHEVSSAHLSRG
jgi:hypothetical protein